MERIKDDARCTDLLGDRREIKAYGENTWSRWARNRPIAYVAFYLFFTASRQGGLGCGANGDIGRPCIRIDWVASI